MNEYCKKVDFILDKIEKAKEKSKFNQNVKLIAVSKTFSSDIVKKVYNCGIENFGENYVQEMLKKQNDLKDCKINWHFIGHLQKNKAKYIYNKIAMLHSLDSIDLAKILDKRLKSENKKLEVLIQINIGKEKSKYGILPEEIDNFMKKIDNFKSLIIKGFMCIPPFTINREEARLYFIKMRKIFEKYKNSNISELSMGMSKDFEIAIEEGATIVRIGTLIFGQRGQ